MDFRTRTLAALQASPANLATRRAVVGFDGIERWTSGPSFLTTMNQPFARMGGVRIARVRQRRRRHNAIKRRRPSMPLRRLTGRITAATPVHRGEREIIARN